MMKSFVSNVFIFLGVFLFLFGAVHIVQRNNPGRLSFASAPQNINSISQAFDPKRILIPSLNINLPIIKTSRSDQWETTSLGVSYFSGSVAPGEKGNSVLYGHNWKSILGDLLNIKTGDTIEIEFEDKKRRFIVDSFAVVYPTVVSVVENSSDIRLTIYTCTGFLDTKRFVVTAFLAE